MAKNSAISKVIVTVAAGTILLVVTIFFRWGPSIQGNAHATEVNKNDIIRVDKKVDRLIIKQEAFITYTTKTVGEIETHAAAMKATVKVHHP